MTVIDCIGLSSLLLHNCGLTIVVLKEHMTDFLTVQPNMPPQNGGPTAQKMSGSSATFSGLSEPLHGELQHLKLHLVQNNVLWPGRALYAVLQKSAKIWGPRTNFVTSMCKNLLWIQCYNCTHYCLIWDMAFWMWKPCTTLHQVSQKLNKFNVVNFICCNTAYKYKSWWHVLCKMKFDYKRSSSVILCC